MKTLGGAKIPVNAGLGFDGLEYAGIVKIFPNYWHAFSAYRASRVLPSVIVAVALRCLHLPFSDANIVRSFEYLNLFSLLIAGFCWWRFVQKFEINTSWRILSFTALFANCAMITIYSYSSVGTDVFAFSLGVVLFYNYFMKKSLVVFSIGLLGAFVFPTFAAITMLLLLFPVQEVHSNGATLACVSPAVSAPVSYNRVLIYLVLTVVVVSFLYLLTLVLPRNFLWHQWGQHFVSQDFSLYLVSRAKSYESIILTLAYMLEGGEIFLLVSSTVILFMYLYKGVQPFIGKIDYPIGLFFKKLKSSLSLYSVVLAVSFIVFCTVIGHCLTDKELIGSLTTLSLLRVLILEFFSLTGINLVASFVYYGLFTVFVIFYWREIVDEAAQWSLGFLGVLSLLLLLSITSESRIYINFVGFVIFLTMLAVKRNNRDKLASGALYFFVIVSMLLSKFWVSIHIPIQPPETNSTFLLPNWQGYFMNFGPWFSLKNYVWYCLILLSCVLFAYWDLVRESLEIRGNQYE
mgnify:CR=1 FL=1